MKPAKHDFPSSPQDTDYRIFPADWEASPNIFFHGTAEKNLGPILREGFKAGPDLASVSYARTSALALAYASGMRSTDSPQGVVIAVRFDSLDVKGIAQEEFGLHVSDPDLQPHVVAYCIVPAAYRHT